MTVYRIYYCTRDGKRFGSEDFDATNDAGAVERSHQLAMLRVPVFEVWHGERLVHRSDPAPPDP